MKLVFITNNFPPEVDGVGDYTYYLSRELGKRGHEIHVICHQRVNSGHSSDKVRVYPSVGQWTGSAYRKILGQIKDIQPDWVVFQYVPYGFHRYGMPVSIVKFMRRVKKSGFRIFVFFHEFFIGFQFRSHKATLVALTQIWITRRMCRYADEVATSTDHYVEVLQRWRQDIHQIPVGSNIPVCEEATPSAAASAGTTFKMITFGIRDTAVLLRFFEYIKQEIKEAELIVCGKQKCQNGEVVPEDVHFTGYLPGEEVAKWLTRADVFLLPDYVSKTGAGGTCLKSGSLAAAIAAGLPVIGMSGKMNDRLLSQVEGLQLVDYYHQETWKSAVLNVYRRRGAREDQRAATRKFYEQHLSWSAIGDRHQKIINNKKE